jgi:hypothetical protein
MKEEKGRASDPGGSWSCRAFSTVGWRGGFPESGMAGLIVEAEKVDMLEAGMARS